MDYSILVWGIVGIAALFAEYLTRVRVAICLFPASLFAVFFALFFGNLFVEIVSFLAVSIIFLIVRALVMVPRRPTADEGVNVDQIVGSHCRVIEAIDNVAGSGLVKCRGFDWAARSLEEDEVYDVGENVTVVAVEGVRLVCKK